MKQIFVLMITLFCIGFSPMPMAYMPHQKGSTEIRLTATSKKGLTSLSPHNWNIEGVLVGSSVLHKDFNLSGVFKLSQSDEDNSELGALVSYNINKFITLAIAGNINDKKSFGSVFVVNGNFELGKVVFMPYALIDHKALGEIGVVQSFKIEGVLFSVGVSYLPLLGTRKYNNLRLMVGAGIKNS